ncbi:MAG: NAD-dependent epimerase/dehydratase family protein, partial [Chitinophagales bacterium]|nr:NAD-dependent epimerase/dehydratase family protein [Chitinophagales bacterium]
MKNILITGGSGLIGSRLTEILMQQSYNVAHLSRTMKTGGIAQTFQWDIAKEYIDVKAIQWADAIIHLAGEGIATKRWTAKRKKEIINSRISSSALLSVYLRTESNNVRTIIAASAIGFYG